MEKKLSKSIINTYGIASFGFQLFVNMEVFYFAIFLTDFALLPVAIAGLVMSVTSIFDIVWVPTAGIILEKSNMKWGKYRSWLLIGPPIAAGFFLLQFSKIGTPTVTAILISIGFIVSHLVWNIFYAGHVSMTSSLTKVSEERIALSANRGQFNFVGAILFSLIGLKLIKATGYTVTILITSAVMILGYWLVFYMTREHAVHTDNKNVKTKTISIVDMFKQIGANPPLIGLMLSEIGRYTARFTIMGLAVFYFKYVTQNMAYVAVFFTGLNVVALGAATLAGPIAKRIGNRNTYIASISLFIVALLAVWFFEMTAFSFLVIMFIAYIGYGIPDALGVALYAETVDYSEWKTGQNARGFIMSLISFPIKSSIFIKSVLITFVLSSVAYIANMAPTPELAKGLNDYMTLVPAVILFVGLVAFTLLYKIDKAKVDLMQKEISERK